MCLITTNKAIKIRKPIITYKIVIIRDNIIHAAYQTMFKYIPKKLYITTLGIKEDNTSITSMPAGFDNNDMRACKQYMYDNNISNYTIIEAGFHSALSIKRLQPVYPNQHIFQCIIPTGSTVYKDHSGLIVSNQIKLIKLLQ